MSRSMWLILGALVASTSGCASGARDFATPDEGVDALVQAMRPYDESRVEELLGPEAKEVLSSGDDVADAEMREKFLAAYDKKHALETSEDGSSATLVVGDDWPLPIPLVKKESGWHFDTAEGKDEILSRRIGRNEISVIDTCDAIVDAQREFRASDGAFAQRFRSSAGKKDGLYWETKEGEPQSPLGDLVAKAVAEGYEPGTGDEPRPYNGYYYKMLTGQGAWGAGGAKSYVDKGRMTGGFAVVAWPATWGNSGIMTFLVSADGVVYQKDLGAKTDEAAKAITVYDPGDGWVVVD